MGCCGSHESCEGNCGIFKEKEEILNQVRPYNTFNGGIISTVDGSYNVKLSFKVRKGHHHKRKCIKEHEEKGRESVSPASNWGVGSGKEWDNDGNHRNEYIEMHERCGDSNLAEMGDKNNYIPSSIFRAFDRQEKHRRLNRRKEIAKKWRESTAHDASPSLDGFAMIQPLPTAGEVDMTIFNELVESGFEEELAKNALRRSRNNRRLAMDYILSRPSSP